VVTGGRYEWVSTGSRAQDPIPNKPIHSFIAFNLSPGGLKSNIPCCVISESDIPLHPPHEAGQLINGNCEAIDAAVTVSGAVSGLNFHSIIEHFL
jgi:hypothetical protein